MGRRAVAVRADAAAGGDKVVCVGEALFGKYPAVLAPAAQMHNRQAAPPISKPRKTVATVGWLWCR